MDREVLLEAARLRRLQAQATLQSAFDPRPEHLEALAIGQRSAKIIFFYTKPLADKFQLSKQCSTRPPLSPSGTS